MSFLIRIFVVLCVIALHLSFIQTISFGIFAPVTLIAATLVLTTFLGFLGALPYIVVMILIVDSILFGVLQYTSVFFIGIAYMASFSLKRTLLGDRSTLGVLVLSILSGIISIGYIGFLWIFEWGSTIFGTISDVPYWSLESQPLLYTFLLGSLLYGILWFILGRIEAVIHTMQQNAQYIIHR